MAVGDKKLQSDSYKDVDLPRAIELLAEKDIELSRLIHRLKQLEKMIYGSRSVKRTEPIDPSTLLPFRELKELIASALARAQAREAERDKSKEGSGGKDERKRSKRRKLDGDISSDLPRYRRVRKLTTDECSCGCGGELKEVREEVARRFEQIKLNYVEERVTTYYACRKCEKMISIAPDHDSVVEGSILGPELISNLVYQRFGNHTPYHRMEREFKQMGFPISRNVLGRNVLKCGELLQPIYDRIRKAMLGSFLVQIDDTPVVVRNGKEKGRKTDAFGSTEARMATSSSTSAWIAATKARERS